MLAVSGLPVIKGYTMMNDAKKQVRMIVAELESMKYALASSTGKHSAADHLEDFQALVQDIESITNEPVPSRYRIDSLISTVGKDMALSFPGEHLGDLGPFTNQRTIDPSRFQSRIGALQAYLTGKYDLETTSTATSSLHVDVENGLVQIATSNSGTTKQIAFNQMTGTVAEFLSGLQELGVKEEEVEHLREHLEAAHDSRGRINVARNWFANFATEIAGGVVSDELSAALPAIATLVTSFAAGLM